MMSKQHRANMRIWVCVLLFAFLAGSENSYSQSASTPPKREFRGAWIATVIKHVDHIRDLVGIDFIALGSDFEGVERTPTGLEDVTKFPSLTNALFAHGYSREEVRKILGENLLRLFRTICH